VDVYFEEQNIHSISNEGELMLTILASYAQEESRSASENCKWRIRKRFENGELVNLRFMFGYKISKGKIEINPTQAAIIRMIFDDYIAGLGSSTIANKLKEMNVESLHGGTWSCYRILAILKNEKLTGNAMLQKKYVVDHLTKSLKQNNGQLPKYYVTNTHPAIIDQETFDKVQERLSQRNPWSQDINLNENRYPFSSKIKCGVCGRNFKRKKAGNNVSWRCSTYLVHGKSACIDVTP